MLGETRNLVKKETPGSQYKGRHQPGIQEEHSYLMAIMPASPKETREFIAGGEVDIQVAKGYIRLEEGRINQVSKRLQTSADQVFYDESWWVVVASNTYFTGGNPHTKFFIKRAF